MKTFPVVSLEPGDRALLHQAIEGRLREMVTKGLLSEVRSLKARAGLTAAHPSMRAVGYRQAWSHLDRQSGFESETEFFQRALEATRQLAKRQITWQRSFGGLERIDPQTTTLDQMMTVCASLLDRS
jgi:tRNA dimethylallyltransferase